MVKHQLILVKHWLTFLWGRDSNMIRISQWRENHCRTNTSIRRKKEIQKNRTMRIKVWNLSRKINHLSKINWDRKIIRLHQVDQFHQNRGRIKIFFSKSSYSPLNLWVISHEIRKQQKNLFLSFSISRLSKNQNGGFLMQKLPIFTCRINGFKI